MILSRFMKGAGVTKQRSISNSSGTSSCCAAARWAQRSMAAATVGANRLEDDLREESPHRAEIERTARDERRTVGERA